MFSRNEEGSRGWTRRPESEEDSPPFLSPSEMPGHTTNVAARTNNATRNIAVKSNLSPGPCVNCIYEGRVVFFPLPPGDFNFLPLERRAPLVDHLRASKIKTDAPTSLFPLRHRVTDVVSVVMFFDELPANPCSMLPQPYKRKGGETRRKVFPRARARRYNATWTRRFRFMGLRKERLAPDDLGSCHKISRAKEVLRLGRRSVSSRQQRNCAMSVNKTRSR